MDVHGVGQIRGHANIWHPYVVQQREIHKKHDGRPDFKYGMKSPEDGGHAGRLENNKQGKDGGRGQHGLYNETLVPTRDGCR